MNFNRITAIIALVVLTVTASAQTSEKAVRYAGSVTVGPSGYSTITALQGMQTDYESEAPVVNWMDKGLRIGAEFSLILYGDWRIDIGGGFNAGLNPGYTGREGTVEEGEEIEIGDIPNYRAVATQQSYSYLAYLGFARYFGIRAVPALKPYVGMRVPFSYGINTKSYDEVDMGRSISETFTLGGSVVVGADFFVADAFYVGASIDAVKYTYSYSAHKPQEGLAALAADAHNMGFLASPMIKIGFVF